MPQVKANNLTIEYEDSGPKDGPVLLLIMGLATWLTTRTATVHQGTH